MSGTTRNRMDVDRYAASGVWRERTVAMDALDRAFADPDGAVFVGEDGPWTYASVMSDAEALAASLYDLGLRSGDVLSFQLPNWPETAVINLAACRLGLVCCPLVPIYRDNDLSFMLRDSRSRVLFIPGTFRGFSYTEMLERLKPSLPDLHIVTVRSRAPGMSDFRDLAAAGAGRSIDWPEVSPRSPKLLLYTSGTTGLPKAVLHDHNTLARAISVSADRWRVREGDAVFMPSPVTHATGYSNALELPFMAGTRCLLMERWDSGAAVTLIDTYEATVTVGATPFLKELTASALAAASDLPSLRVFACGGASVPETVIDAANTAFRQKPAFRVYGSTEAPYITLGFAGSDPARRGATTDGAVVDYEVRVLDDTGADLPRGSEGEIAVRGPSLFRGYMREEDNQGSFTPDGFFLTGDIGIYREDGAILITDRKKDLIIRGGENISAREIEHYLHRHPAVFEASVVAMPHARLGEGVCAYVIAEEGQALSLPDLADFLLAERLAPQKVPERLEILMDFPRTPSGKVRKNVLRQMALESPAVGG